MNSPKQLGEILFEKMKLDPKAKNKNRTIRYFRRCFAKIGEQTRNHQTYFRIQNLPKIEINLC
jgi:DNA polymerase I-like protein with 3'-5' exonuclease and polymerase domains